MNKSAFLSCFLAVCLTIFIKKKTTKEHFFQSGVLISKPSLVIGGGRAPAGEGAGLREALQIPAPWRLSDRVPAPTCGYTFGELEGSSDQSRICGRMQWVTSNFPNICSCIRYSRAAGHELVTQQISVCLDKNMTDNDWGRYFQYGQFYRHLNLDRMNSIYYSWAHPLFGRTHLIPTWRVFATGHEVSRSCWFILCLSA